MATVFQTPEWEKFKLKTGWQKSWRIFDILVLEKKIPLLGSMLYSPMMSRDQTKLAMEKIFLDQIQKIADEEKSIFYRMESVETFDSDIKPEKFNYQKSFEEMQPEHTLLIDLTKSEDEILSQMKQKGRYNIKIAEKNNLEFRTGKIEEFFPLYEQMAKRQKISFRNISYFQELIDFLGPKGYALVFTVADKEPLKDDDLKIKKIFAEEPILASAIVIFFKETCIYLFGGSSDLRREKMATYKLHFEIMLEAKKRGCKVYDMFGIAPTDDEKHPWAGITRFKKQFGGEETQLLGSWDMIFASNKYKIFKLAEKIRRK